MPTAARMVFSTRNTGAPPDPVFGPAIGAKLFGWI
jgi:hypothetical protein